MPEVTPTAAPTAEPTPEPPGFEAVFANFFASQKPLLKMLRYCRHVSNRILSAEEEKEVNTIQHKQQNKKCKILRGRFFFIPFLLFLINHEITQISTRKQKINYGHRLTQIDTNLSLNLLRKGLSTNF